MRSGAHQVGAAAGVGGALLSPQLEAPLRALWGLSGGPAGVPGASAVRVCVCVCVATPAETRLLGVGVNAVPMWVPVPRCPEGPAWETRGHPGRCGGAVGEGRRPRGSRALLSISTCQVLYLELTSFHPSSPQTCKEGGFIPICQMRKQRFPRSHGLIATKLGFEPRFPQLL